jgi:uncharacterized protein YegP (UPF0339 family)
MYRPEEAVKVVQIYRALGRVSREWRWRALGSNGQIVATAGEGYKRRGHAVKMVKRLFPTARIDAPRRWQRSK